MIVILYTLLPRRKPSSVPLIFRNLVSRSPFSPFLALKVPYVQEIIKYQAREIDLLVVLLLDGIMESANQVLLVMYFALYINKTGLDATNILSIITNALGLVFKLMKIIHVYFIRKKDLTEEKTKNLTSSSSPGDAASIEMINVAFQIDVPTATTSQSHTRGKIHS